MARALGAALFLSLCWGHVAYADPNVSLTITDSPDPVRADGSLVTYSVTLTNNASYPIPEPVPDPSPAHHRVEVVGGGAGSGPDTVSASASPGTCTINPDPAHQGFRCDVGRISPGASVHLTVVLRAPVQGPGTYTGDYIALVVRASWDGGGQSWPTSNSAIEYTTLFRGASGGSGGQSGGCTSVRRGTSRSDRLIGTPLGDRLLGLGGNDVLRGLGGNDCLVGGRGHDKLSGGLGDDKLSGGRGRDKLSGGSGDDKLSGGPGRDKLSGGPGKDSLRGGTDNDSLDSADGISEGVDCGRGRDKATVDRLDNVHSCERVVRREARATPAPGGSPPRR